MNESDEVAKDYETRLRQLWPKDDANSPAFGMADCLILGVGPDGHTCSLFPNHAVLQVSNSWVTRSVSEMSNECIFSCMVKLNCTLIYSCQEISADNLTLFSFSIEDSPKPPPKRITLTYSFINKAAHILVVGKGEQKLEIAKVKK